VVPIETTNLTNHQRFKEQVLTYKGSTIVIGGRIGEAVSEKAIQYNRLVLKGFFAI